jgi:hypothetical protein
LFNLEKNADPSSINEQDCARPTQFRNSISAAGTQLQIMVQKTAAPHCCCAAPTLPVCHRNRLQVALQHRQLPWQPAIKLPAPIRAIASSSPPKHSMHQSRHETAVRNEFNDPGIFRRYGLAVIRLPRKQSG